MTWYDLGIWSLYECGSGRTQVTWGSSQLKLPFCWLRASSGIQDCFMKGRLKNQGLEISEIKDPPRNTVSFLGREWVNNSFHYSLSKIQKVNDKNNIRNDLSSVSLTFDCGVSTSQVWQQVSAFPVGWKSLDCLLLFQSFSKSLLTCCLEFRPGIFKAWTLK